MRLEKSFMEQCVYIFGASTKGQDLFNLLVNSTQIIVKGFLDNDENKKKFCNLNVYSPDKLRSLLVPKDIIVISSMYEKEIANQLEKLGLINGTEYYFETQFMDLLVEVYFKDIYFELNKSVRQDKRVLITLPNGNVLGGVESWSKNLQNALIERNINCDLISIASAEVTDKFMKGNIIEYYKDTGNYLQFIQDLILEVLKFEETYIFLNNSVDLIRVCNVIKKKKLPNKITVISVAHNDNEIVYTYHKKYAHLIDFVICVSDEIKQKIVGYPVEKIKVLISPIKQKFIAVKEYSKLNEPLKIGYSARLTNIQKRALDILDFIRELEVENLDYNLTIVGTGDCEDQIRNFITEKNLEEKVKYIGKIAHEEIYDFWFQQDVFINFSEYEGTSLSMLEALSQSCIPILTRVSGVRRFVDNSNGFLVEVGDISSMVRAFKHLHLNRNKLKYMGEISRLRVLSECKEERYYEEIIKLLD